MNKKKIRRSRDVKWELDGKTVAELLEYLPKLGLPDDARLVFGVYDDYGSYVPEITFDFFELESDQEYALRKAAEQEHSDWERRHYEALKKKFEGVDK